MTEVLNIIFKVAYFIPEVERNYFRVARFIPAVAIIIPGVVCFMFEVVKIYLKLFYLLLRIFDTCIIF